MKKQSNLLVRKENYRLWFEFYKMCCQSNDKDIKLNIEKSKHFYELWGDVKSVKFDDWWKSHEHLFDEPKVKLVKSEDDMESPWGILIEVPLNQSVTDTLHQLKEILTKEQKQTSKKKKITFIGKYRLTDNSEPKLRIVRHILNIYRDVYLKNSRPKIPKLLPMVINYYKGKKTIQLPKSLDETQTDLSNVLKNLERWMKKGRSISINVSKGEFPGNY